MLNKKAGTRLGTKELLELILGVAAVVILIILLVKLFTPAFNIDDETAKSYLDVLEKSLEDLEVGGAVDFNLWGGEPKMVYFGERVRVSLGADNFTVSGYGENRLCFCYEREPGTQEWLCNSCFSLEHPAYFSKGRRVFEDGDKFRITLLDELCLDVSNAGDIAQYNNNVLVWDCKSKEESNNMNQQWVFEDGQIKSLLTNDQGQNLCLDVKSGKPENNSNVHSWVCKGEGDSTKMNQQWVFEDGQIKSLLGDNVCLDVSGASKIRGTNVQLFSCHDGDNQKWALLDSGNIVNSWGGKAYAFELI
jgi:hypothetical protein